MSLKKLFIIDYLFIIKINYLIIIKIIIKIYISKTNKLFILNFFQKNPKNLKISTLDSAFHNNYKNNFSF